MSITPSPSYTTNTVLSRSRSVTLRRARAICLLLLALGLAAFLGSHGVQRMVFLGHAGVGLHDGCIELGLFLDNGTPPRPGLDLPSSLHTRTLNWASPHAAAWRPFHTASGPYHGLAIPLWPALLVTCAGAAWAQGTISGRAKSGDDRCGACDYDLSRLPCGLPCPECGEAGSLAGQHRTTRIVTLRQSQQQPAQ